MLDVSDNVKKKYMSDEYNGDITIQVTGGATYTSGNILSGTASLQESLCSSDTLDFSAVEKSVFKVTLINLDVETIQGLKGKEIKVTQNVAGETVNMGAFTIKDAKNNGDYQFEITAYNGLDKFDRDIGTWWAGIANDGPITAGDMLQSLCDYCGVENAATGFLNNGYAIYKNTELEGTTGLEVLGWIQELAVCFFRVNREGKLVAVRITGGLVPSVTLKPSDSLFPNAENVTVNHEFTVQQKISDLEIADYETKKVTKVQIKNSDKDIGVIVGDGDSAYVISDNPLFLQITGSTEDQTIAKNILGELKNLSFRPFSGTFVGLPYILPGDWVKATTVEGKTATAPVLNRTLGAVGFGQDKIEAKGKESTTVVKAVNKQIKVLGRRTHEIVNTVEELSSKISNVQTAQGEIEKKVTENTTAIKQTAESIGTVAERVTNTETKIGDQEKLITDNTKQIEDNVKSLQDQAKQIDDNAGKIDAIIKVNETQQTSIDQNAKAIKLKASQDTVTEIQAELNKKVSKLGLYPAETRYPGETLYPEGDFSEYTTHREVTAEIAVESDKITSKVEETYEKQIDAQKTKEELSSTITQTAAGIESKVEKKVDSDEYTGDTIVSKINQTAEEVKIEASHVAINGLLTITNSDGTKSITVPTKTSQLTNDSIKVPTKTSELTNDSGYVTSIDDDVYVTYADLAAKKAQASDYTEINGAKITTGEIDAVDIYSSNLTFGDTSNSYVKMRTNDAKTGGIIEGSGVIEFKTKGKFNAENQSTSGGNSASIIRMANDTVTVTDLDKASATNNRNYINLMNYLTTKASSEDSAYYSDLANSIYVVGNSEPSKGNTMKLQNYYYTDPTYTGNIIDIESSKHLNGTTKYDYNSIQMKNYYPGSSIYANGIFLWNNAYTSTDGFTGAKIALRNFNSSGKKENEIYLSERNGNPMVLISNNNASEKAVNDIKLSYGSGAPTLKISNRSAASVLCNQIDMEARTGNGNIFWYYNYDYSENDGETKANQMYIWSNTSGSNQAVIQNFSGGSEKNLLALYSSGTYGVVLKNIASTGKTSQLYFQNDGRIRLETNTGGTSYLQVSTNGNMDVQANNALVLKSEKAYVTMQTVSATESGHIHRWHYKLGWCSVKGTNGNTYQALVGYESA